MRENDQSAMFALILLGQDKDAQENIRKMNSSEIDRRKERRGQKEGSGSQGRQKGRSQRRKEAGQPAI